MHSRVFLALPAVAFCLNVSGYDEQTAIEYANLAGAAYCAKKELSDWSCGYKCIPGVSAVHVCDGRSTQAWVGLWKDGCVVSFEGTNGLDSAKTDMKLWKSPFLKDQGCSYCQVHSGFLREWKSLKHCVADHLTALGCSADGKPVRATGHSLGAAVAVLGAADLQAPGKTNRFYVKQLYNFGMPRVGNQAFVTYFEDHFGGDFYRITHGQDPFIDMPLGPLYVHLAPEVFYKDQKFIPGNYHICNVNPDSDRKCAAQYFPDAQTVIFASAQRWHHEYMGVHTTQEGCKTGTVDCDDDIPQSWCMAMAGVTVIPCNADQRGKDVYCNAPTGACRCSHGFCPVNGKCMPEGSLEPSTSLTQQNPSTAEVAGLFLLFGGLLGGAVIRLVSTCSLWRQTDSALSQQLIA